MQRILADRPFNTSFACFLYYFSCKIILIFSESFRCSKSFFYLLFKRPIDFFSSYGTNIGLSGSSTLSLCQYYSSNHNPNHRRPMVNGISSHSRLPRYFEVCTPKARNVSQLIFVLVLASTGVLKATMTKSNEFGA